MNVEHRSQISAILGLPSERIPTSNSWSYDQILEGIREEKIKGLWIIATNSSHSWIHQNEFNHLLSRLDFLVVQDMYPTTETARRAHLYLPAAGWGEKEGTFINSERRIGLVKKIARAPGQAMSDFNIFRLMARYWGRDEMFADWKSPEAAFQILKRVSRNQPCDISGIRDYRMIEQYGGIQWPFRESTGSTAVMDINRHAFSERRLFEDGKFYHPDGKAKFLYEEPRPPAEPVDEDFPFILLTGRGSSAQWHTGSRTAKSKVLNALTPQNCYVELNPLDALRLGITSTNAPVRVSSRRGSLLAVAFITATVQPGQVFMPMHYEEVNRLTHPSFDPYSRQPNYKYCAVSVQLDSGA